ncbi:hypothetical protein I9W82_000578 [Candida metapsilosis]|uniref:Uncharacterized protein n=1 Tax=Candida metapsilosis TaxID=273372 RepID=A0A8H7ZLA5_9ASCO|nr:hypothetical protein I9W82_000578 [Candida metapsilosis]
MSESHTIALDGYQWDVLLKVLTFTGVNNIVQLLAPDNRVFLNSNQNLKRAIECVIGNETGVQYNNRIDRYSFLHMYLRTPNCIDKSRLKFLASEAEFVTLYNYCASESLPQTLNIAYYMWTSNDLMNFRELVTKLRTSEIQLNIELEFDPAFPYDFDGEQFMESFSVVENQTKSLVIDGCKRYFVMDLERFSNMENLSLYSCPIAFIQNLGDSKLRSLVYEFDNSIDTDQLLDALPSTLKTLQTSSEALYLIAPKVRDRELGLPKLETIKFCDGRGSDLLDSLEFLKFACSASTKCIELKSHVRIPHISNSVTSILENASQEGMELSSLSLAFGLTAPLNVYPKTSLTLTNMENPDILTDLQYPPTLKRLDLSNNSIEEISPILQVIPLDLEFLSFEHNPISWSTCIPNFSKFAKLNYLRLMNTHIGKHFSRFQFPDSLEILSLEVNQIGSIDQVKFPKSLVNLGIGSNKIRVVYKPRLPPTIQTIHFTENNISKVDLSTNHIGQPLRLKTLYLDYNKISSLSNVKLPSTLINLNFDNCQIQTLSNIEFGKTIEELSFSGCEIKELRNVTFESESRLKYLCLSGNALRSLDITPPQSVTNINLSLNKFTKIPIQLANLKNLKYLNLAQNKLRTANYSFQTSSIAVLDLSYNSIRNVQLSFPKNTETCLRSINLCSNEISDLFMKSIGHDPSRGTLHNQLFEIDLSLISFNATKLIDLEQEMPSSAQCLWHSFDAESEFDDDSEDEYVPNLFSDRFLRRKRSDVPSMT